MVSNMVSKRCSEEVLACGNTLEPRFGWIKYQGLTLVHTSSVSRDPRNVLRRFTSLMLLVLCMSTVCFYKYLVDANTSSYRIELWTGYPSEAFVYDQTMSPPLLDQRRLYYNRVPKAAGTTMLTVLHRLAERNNFSHHSSDIYNRRNISYQEQLELVMDVTNTTPPASFDRHLHFVNFNLLGQASPVFINVVRDPVERVVSDYYYRRAVARKNLDSYPVTPSEYWLNKPIEECLRRGDAECRYITGYTQIGHMVPYFCGHYLRCAVVNDQWALERAKRNIELYYGVVGLVELLPETMSVLEHRLPLFFQGATEVFERIGLQNANPDKPKVAFEAKLHLRLNLTNDLKLYNFIKERLLQQFYEITGK
ncbi:uronyl 2-sulfotransferase-like [Tropilaelaps mercedesae]|uniref:Uronyl 2-sulfotransferase-like n=1 Tax=Tropilaelaps mercedesae TaxID=418985 RepID=A0A1V9XM35_9ACAR|nr:uronyl 2-sulfotransferase-like [Tropilaelaps mercedesae]